MNTTTLAELKVRANEVFSSIIVFCPDFPAAAQTSASRKFEQLADVLEAVLEKVRSDDTKQWLRICIQETQQARKAYEDGDWKKGKDLMQQAEEHFKNALSKKQTTARFIAGESGAAHNVDLGFPQ